MSQSIPYYQFIRPPFAFQQIPPSIHKVPHQEMNAISDFIFAFNFDHYQGLSLQQREAYEVEQHQQ